MLVEEMGSTLVTIAKDVKIQVEFNPAKVGGVPPDRLREPDPGPRGLQRRHQGRRRDRRGPPRDGAVRDRPAGQGRRPRPESTRSSTQPGRRRPPAQQRSRFTVKLRYKQPERRHEPADRARASSTRAATSATPPDDLKFAARRRRLRDAAARLDLQGEPDLRRACSRSPSRPRPAIRRATAGNSSPPCVRRRVCRGNEPWGGLRRMSGGRSRSANGVGGMNPLAPLAVFYWIASTRSNDHRNSSWPRLRNRRLPRHREWTDIGRLPGRGDVENPGRRARAMGQ